MKNRNIFGNSNGFLIFDFTCVRNLNALKIFTPARHKSPSIDLDRKKKENIQTLR